MGFFTPNVTTLAERRDIAGLVKVVVGKDAALAQDAAAPLGRLIAQKHAGPEVVSAVQSLEASGTPAAVAALAEVLRHDFSAADYGKSLASAALYRAGATVVLRDVIMALRRSAEKGAILHVSVSRELLEMAVAAGDLALVEFLLVNGAYQGESEVSPAYALLHASGGTDAISRVVDDTTIFSGVSKSRGFFVVGRKFTNDDIIKPWIRDRVTE